MADQDLVGAVILGHYRIVGVIARGGMGVIYLARNEGAAGFVRPVVVKRIVPDRTGDESFVRMFVREARILSQLRHPNIVGILDFAEEQGAYFMVLEYVHGYTLRQWSRFVALTQRTFPADIAIDVAASIAEALHYAHTLPGPDGQPLHIVHRDISPANVLIDVDGHVKLADFGIARTQRDRTDISPGRELKGKFAYMAPELLQLRDPSPASDLYSCGVLLHELLVGRNEFHKGDPASTALNVMSHTLTPVHELRPDVPDTLTPVIAKATARAPHHRYETAQEFADALRAVRRELSQTATIGDVTAMDFVDPRFAELLGAQPLDELEHAWRTETAPAPPATVPIAARRSEATASYVARPGARWRLGGIIFLGAVLISAAVVAYFVVRDRAEAPVTRFVLVDGQATGYGEGAPDGPEAHPRPTPPTPAVDPPVVPPVTPATPDAGAPDAATSKVPPPRVGATDELGRAFAGRRRLVAQCVERNASSVQGAPEIVIRFHVGTDGQVTGAELTPAALQGTAVGTCILEVARATRFPAQPAPVSFRIPVSFRQR